MSMPVKASLRGQPRLWLGLAILLVFLLNAIGVLPLSAISGLERQAYDLRVRATTPHTLDERIVIADIDEKSLAELGRWPWGRGLIADLVDTLHNHYQVRVTGFDVIFAEPDNSSGLTLLNELAAGPLKTDGTFQQIYQQKAAELDGDARLAASLKDKPVVLGMVFTSSRGPARNTPPTPFAQLTDEGVASLPGLIRQRNHVANLDVLSENARITGFFDNPSIDADGIFRRVPLFQLYGNRLYPSLALATAHIALGSPPAGLATGKAGNYEEIEGVRLGDDVFVPTDRHANVLVPWRGRAGSFPYLSIADILAKKVPVEQLQDRIVLVGTSAPGLLDLRATPLARAYPGVEVHANIVSGILDDTVRLAPAWGIGLEILLLVAVALVTLLVTTRLTPLWQVSITLALSILLVLMNFAAWKQGLVLPMASPLLLLLLLFMLIMAWGFFVEAQGKRSITRLFGQYVPPDLVDEMAANPESISLEGRSKELTVLFSDVRDFTSISEGLSATELSALMNAYLTSMTHLIHKHRGTIDKYMGDAIMAFWGAPVDDPAHARNALLSAMDMVTALDELHRDFAARGWPAVKIGIGLNTGNMNVGNMGSEFRMAYTVMGDAVNLGSRLEGLSKQYGVTLVVSESTRAAVPEFSYRSLDCVRVKGKLEPVRIYEPVGDTSTLDAGTLARLSRWETALGHYCHQEWDAAESDMRALINEDDRPVYRLFLERIAHFRHEPPPADWDGVFTYTTK
ncbi:MAG: adenylate/guanylate cyclase domain-containing protein [Moraxellaceae bacterium]|nr:adenylate/guanylate cyclase domain-containing protein [Moraxellaceae bacterium]